MAVACVGAYVTRRCRCYQFEIILSLVFSWRAIKEERPRWPRWIPFIQRRCWQKVRKSTEPSLAITTETSKVLFSLLNSCENSGEKKPECSHLLRAFLRRVQALYQIQFIILLLVRLMCRGSQHPIGVLKLLKWAVIVDRMVLNAEGITEISLSWSFIASFRERFSYQLCCYSLEPIESSNYSLRQWLPMQ